MIQVQWFKYKFNFKFRAGTSRGFLTDKYSWFIKIRDTSGTLGIGECSPLKGLSIDDRPDFENKLDEICRKVSNSAMPDIEHVYEYVLELTGYVWPSIRMGLETALMDFLQGGNRLIFNNDFILGQEIPINGLVWMGDKKFMAEQINKKIDEGFTCIKMKIGALNFETELDLIKQIRRDHPANEIAIRLDANGAFTVEEAKHKLNILAPMDIHSIEQPISTGQWEALHELCSESPLAVALDEELIGVHTLVEKENLLEVVNPAYIVLKPSLTGGFAASGEWIHLAEKYHIGWWVTSALESNIGLNAVAQFTANYRVSVPQGLGTGQLYSNNIPSPLEVIDGQLRFAVDGAWDIAEVL